MSKGNGVTTKARTKAPAATPAAKPSVQPAPARKQTLKFRTDHLKSSYCNMANVTSTREEVVLNFGVNQNWDQPADPARELEVDMQHRVILSPVAARRLSDALTHLMRASALRPGPHGLALRRPLGARPPRPGARQRLGPG